MALKTSYSAFFCEIFLLNLSTSVLSQQIPPENRVVLSPLALGGMLQGLLNMQVRPDTGFYEEKYKTIFNDDNVKHEPPKYESVLHLSDEELDKLVASYNTKEVLSNDEKILKSAVSGQSSNLCFDVDKITKNRLLGLMCVLKKRKELPLL
ncbi:uncharacterized protein CEXT_494471 [Caerostris extrusa]|uniref:Melanin-concentrating hormone n=1 Tax=Caerostris extrusa TaxID=172846 RepID=A0AAV4RI47_CAEEX|nr:uncharacterized protein CEXT_494471 [Caerostris extrusa]